MATKETKSVFETLNAIDCSRHIEKKNGLSYLSWAWAWTKVKENYPTASYEVHHNQHETPIIRSEKKEEQVETKYGPKTKTYYVWGSESAGILPIGAIHHTDGRTCWVETSVTIEGVTHTEYLPIMDSKNESIPADIVSSMDMNKAIQRSLTKAVARHGLGLYIYAGEDLPEAAIEDGVSGAIAEIQAATSTEELKDIYTKYTPTMNASPQAKNDITAALTKRKTELLSPSAA